MKVGIKSYLRSWVLATCGDVPPVWGCMCPQWSNPT